MDALKSLPNLRHLQIAFSKADIPLEVNALRGLQEIAISTETTTQPHQDRIFENLAKAIAQNPGLTSIDICGIRHYGNTKANKFQSLHQFFKYYPASTPLLRLRKLRLRSLLLRLDDVTLPHLAYLTSLSLENIDDPFNPTSYSRRFGNDDFAQKHPELMADRKRYGSPLLDVWKALQTAGIHLEEIIIDTVPSAFLDYLSSYSGLSTLDLGPGGFEDGESSDAMAIHFYNGRLETHAQSLEDLRIMAYFEGLWCYGPHNVRSISNLTNLKHLGMSVRSSELVGHDKIADPSRPDAIVSSWFFPNCDLIA